MLDKWVHMIAMILVVIGALNWGLIGALGFNAVAAIAGRGVVANAIYALVGLAGLLVAFRRDTYLPFLGETVMPCAAIPESTPEHADTEVTVSELTPGAKILFWASEPASAATEGLARIKTWDQAYLEFANAGVTTVDSAGRAILRVRKPQPYTVPVHGRIESHVHWRICGTDGILGPVQNTMLALSN
jgi:uncharacterized membrane protein YuzA (DUF378 family)